MLARAEREQLLAEARRVLSRLSERAGTTLAPSPSDDGSPSGDPGDAARWERCRRVLRDVDPESYRDFDVLLVCVAALSVAPVEN